jgi:hypothetical protein
MRDTIFLTVFIVAMLTIGFTTVAGVWATEPPPCPESFVCQSFQW